MKLTYLKNVRQNQWRRIQEQRVYRLIQIALEEVKNEPYRRYWVERLWKYYCIRLRHLTEYDWIRMIAGFTDQQAYGKLKQNKARTYCLLIRDSALIFCREHGIKTEKGFDELWDTNQVFEYAASATEPTYLSTRQDMTATGDMCAEDCGVRIAGEDGRHMK